MAGNPSQSVASEAAGGSAFQGSSARTGGLVFWLPPEEAARRFGVTTDELTRRVRKGEITMRAKVAGGAMLATLCSTDLMRLFGAPKALGGTPNGLGGAPNGLGGPPRASEPPPAETEAQLVERHGALVEAEERARMLELHNARLEGRLETAERIERGLQRYADKLEVKLEAAETLRLNLARAVGQLEAEMQRLQARLEIAESESPRLIEAPRRDKPAPQKKRGWFRR